MIKYGVLYKTAQPTIAHLLFLKTTKIFIYKNIYIH